MTNRFRLVYWGVAAAAAMVFLGAGTARAQADHYLCYKGVYAKGEAKLTAPFPTRELVDAVEDRVYDVKKALWHCNPATKIHKGQTFDPSNPNIHLEGYQIALSKTVTQTELKPRNVFIVDQFGTLPLVLKKPESVEVRASKINLGPAPQPPCSKGCPSGTSCQTSAGVCVPTGDENTFLPPPPFPNANVNNYKCYKAATQPGIKFNQIVGKVLAQDQFGGKCTAGNALTLGAFCTSNAACDTPPTGTGDGVCGPIGYDIVKPSRVCLPTNKANEDPGAETSTDALSCYKIKLTSVKPAKPPKFPGFLVADSNGNFPDSRLNVKPLLELCVPATARTYFCGDGVVDQPFEDCELPNTNDPGHCITTPDPKSVKCSKTCQCPIVAGCYPYHVSDFSMSITALAAALGGDPIVFDLSSATAGGGNATLNMCYTAADTSGRRAVFMDKDSWFFDAISIPSSDSLPFDLSVRLCAEDNATGVIWTTSTGASYPATVCVAGDPAKQRLNCVTDSDCDLTPGDGICATRDVDYTGDTDNSGTTYTQGDGKKDKAGSSLAGTTLRADVFLGTAACNGTGALTGDPSTNCYSCDCITPAPAGRVGITCDVSVLGLSLPLPMRFTTGTAENTITQAGNGLLGSEVAGNGYLVTGRSLQYGAANGKLGISTFLGNVDAQFFARVAFSPQ